MYAYRKSDGAEFPCGSDDVCRIEQGSTNPYLSEPRLLEQFLKKIEPHHNRACDALAENRFTHDDLLVLSGFIAFVVGCSPTAMRHGAVSFERLARTEIELLDRAHLLDDAPAELGSKTATELLRDGVININTDQKFPQAVGISAIVELARSFATFHWEILLNRHSERAPFLTSDYPAAIERSDGQVTNRIVPLRPDLAVRIVPQVRPPNRPDLPSDFRYRLLHVSPSEVTSINRSVVKCAEDLIFSPVRAPWVTRLVRKSARFRLELEHTRVANGSGFLLLNRVVIKERRE